MTRDARGRPGRIVLKNQPRLKLTDLLRRRKQTLRHLLDEMGIRTYTSLIEWCNRMGVVPPTQDEFHVVFPLGTYVNSAQEGVVVVGPTVPRSVLVDLGPKRGRKKKDAGTSEASNGAEGPDEA